MTISSWKISYEFVDREGNTARTRIAFPVSAYSYEQIEAKAVQFYNLFTAISDAPIASYRIFRNYRPMGEFSPGEESNVSRTAIICVANTNDNYTVILVSSPRLDLLLGDSVYGGDIVFDTSLPEFQAVASLFTVMTDEYDNSLASIIIAGICE